MIPKEVRLQAGVQPGQEYIIVTRGGMITLLPDRPLAEMRGFLRGMRITGFREKKAL